MRRFIILDDIDVLKITHDEMVRLPADEDDDCDIIVLSEEAYAKYLKFLEEDL